MTDRTRRPTDAQIITRGVELLNAGVLASGLPNWLQIEFGLTPEKARKMATEAIKRHKQRGKLDTKELDEPG